MEIERIFSSIDQISEKVNSSRKEPEFSEEIKKREERTPSMIHDDNDVLRQFARLIAFSQNAPSDKVSGMLDKGIFDDIFHNFEIDKVAKMNPRTVRIHHWNKIRVIRFLNKITSIIGCAKSLASIKSKHGSFMDLLKKCDIPLNLKSEADIERFWQGFNRLKNELENENIPFFKQSTSRLHFLLHIGYGCIKPDQIVMQVSKKIGLVESEKGERNRLNVVKTLQRYCVDRKLKPSIVDFYLLIYGGQRWARQFVNPQFYGGGLVQSQRP